MTSKVENAIELVKNSPASIFTKEDVIKLLQGISIISNETIHCSTEPNDDEDGEDNVKVTMTEDQINELIDAVHFDLGMGLDSDDMLDYGSARFDLDGDTISLTSVDVDTSNVESVVEDAIRNWFANNIL
jgi:hypothetical protein